MNSSVAIVKCVSYDSQLVQKAVNQGLDLIGGISNFVKPQAKVLLKPNLLMAKTPESAITTHPEVVRAVIKKLKELDCVIFLGDGPSVWGKQIENVDEVYECTGIKKVCQEEGIQLVKFDKKEWKGKIPFASWVDACDCVINLPKFKTHDFTILTGAIKNLFGLVPGTYKTELHKEYCKVNDFSKMLVDIYEKAKPCLTIVDAIVAMQGDGPATGGIPRKTDLILVSSDCVALDSIMSLIMGIRPFDILTTKEATLRGLGNASLDSITIYGEDLQRIIGKPFVLPTTSFIRKIPPGILKLSKKLIRYYPYVLHENCIRCEACIKACPNKCISKKNEKITFDYTDCIACFCCQEVCPAAAIKVKKSIFAKIIGL